VKLTTAQFVNAHKLPTKHKISNNSQQANKNVSLARQITIINYVLQVGQPPNAIKLASYHRYIHEKKTTDKFTMSGMGICCTKSFFS